MTSDLDIKRQINLPQTHNLQQRIYALRYKTDLSILALGDSSVFGVGDVAESMNGAGPGWVGRIAHDLSAGKFINLGRNGSRARNLVSEQLPAATIIRPDLVLMCIGTNDVLRGDFSISEIRGHLETTISTLNSIGAVVVVLALPDPTRTAVGPKAVKRIFKRRIGLINETIWQVAKIHEAVVIGTWDDDSSYSRENWHVDRMHPSSLGHQAIADKVRRSLSLPRRSRKKLGVTKDVQRKDELKWLLRHGSKWFLKRSFDLIPTLALLVIMDKLDGSRDTR